MSVLIISSSLNPDSNSRLLAREAERVLREDGQAVTFLDLRDLPLPLCDGDKAYADPNVLRLDKLMAETDAIIVATPIYNYDGNAAIKNLIELTGDAWENKTVAFLCSAGGMGSFMSIMGLANSLMLDFRCLIVPRFVYATGKAFSGEKIVDSEIVGRVAECARATVKLMSAMK
jgi:NAD(P)H-dependent FMN reductase